MANLNMKGISIFLDSPCRRGIDGEIGERVNAMHGANLQPTVQK